MRGSCHPERGDALHVASGREVAQPAEAPLEAEDAGWTRPGRLLTRSIRDWPEQRLGTIGGRPKPMTFGAACRNGHKVYPSSLGQPSSMFANQPSAVCPPSFGDYENECLCDQACSSTLRAELSHGMPSRFAGEQRNQVRSLCAGSSAVVHGVERCLFQTVRTGFAGREDPIGYLGPGDMVSDRDAPLVKCASGPCDDAPLLAEDPMGQSPHAALRGASPLGG